MTFFVCRIFLDRCVKSVLPNATYRCAVMLFCNYYYHSPIAGNLACSNKVRTSDMLAASFRDLLETKIRFCQEDNDRGVAYKFFSTKSKCQRRINKQYTYFIQRAFSEELCILLDISNQPICVWCHNFEIIEVQTSSAPQNDCRNLSFVKDS